MSVIAEENDLKDYENVMLYPPSYFLFQLEQACSTCLILACSRIAADQQVWSTVLDLFVSFIDVYLRVMENQLLYKNLAGCHLGYHGLLYVWG